MAESHSKSLKETQRIETCFEQPYWDKGLLVAGMDEAGRGPLAGPCVAAAVVLPAYSRIPGVDDSKKLSEKKRQQLYDIIRQQAVSFAVGIVDNRTVDEINILNAARCAFAEAFAALETKPAYVFCDRIYGIDIDAPYEEIVGGDRLCYSVAAASIIAKVTRDGIMRAYEDQYPGYGFAQHKGYGTKQHRESIRALGVCGIHRMSFLTNILK